MKEFQVFTLCLASLAVQGELISGSNESLFKYLMVLQFFVPTQAFDCTQVNQGMLHRDPTDCTSFYMCDGRTAHKYTCPSNLVFNPNFNVCDWAHNVNCESSTTENLISTQTTSTPSTIIYSRSTSNTNPSQSTTVQTRSTTMPTGGFIPGKKVVCYYPNWAYWRQGIGKYQVRDIDFSLCTHVIYSFAVLSPDYEIVAHDTYLDMAFNWGLGNYRLFDGMRGRYPNTKLMIALGGWDDSQDNKGRYQTMLRSQSYRQKFVNSAVLFLQKYGFDGLDLDYEFPDAGDKVGFASWARELKAALAPYGYELTAAISAGESEIRAGLDIPSLSQSLDAIHIMTYDYHGSWETQADHHAPMSQRSWDTVRNDVKNTVNVLRRMGAPANKLVLGIPTYGKSFTVLGTNGAPPMPSSGGGVVGPITNQVGTLSFMEICLKIKNNAWTLIDDPAGPYAYKGDQWVGFDTAKSTKAKAQYVLDQDLGGAMIWDLPSDDFSNQCGQGPYPLLTAINQVLTYASP
ncbi:probable chitinase 10 isoform X1 [Tigriopus californicus]|nr:probable chitinase 10 isoform X1 [Tigriopus californicus]